MLSAVVAKMRVSFGLSMHVVRIRLTGAVVIEILHHLTHNTVQPERCRYIFLEPQFTLIGSTLEPMVITIGMRNGHTE